MSSLIPSVPKHLFAVNTYTASKSTYDYKQALSIFNECIDKLKQAEFPCEVKLFPFNQNNPHIDEICNSLTHAGYIVIKKEIRQLRYHHSDGEYEDVYWIIDIKNPYLF